VYEHLLECGVGERIVELLAGEPVAVLARPLMLAVAVDPAAVAAW
jgi:hypothetical protein